MGETDSLGLAHCYLHIHCFLYKTLEMFIFSQLYSRVKALK